MNGVRPIEQIMLKRKTATEIVVEINFKEFCDMLV